MPPSPPPLPTFLGIGAGKAGTTWLYACLEEHPDVFVAPQKEVRFFSHSWDEGLDWYRGHFSEWAGESAIGEISPSYATEPASPARIRETVPEARLILLCREPIARAYSHYCMELRTGKPSDDVDAELRPGSRFVEGGLYHASLQRYLDHFPREQIGVFLYDDLKADPRRFLASVLDFLGVSSEGFEPTLLHARYHQRRPRPRFPSAYKRAIRAMQWGVRRSALVRLAVRGVRRRGWTEALHRLNRGPEFPPLPDATARRLAAWYADDTAALSELLGRDLSHWPSGSG